MQEVDVDAAEDEVVALAGEHLGAVHADQEHVLAVAAHQYVEAVRVGDDVVAVLALDEVAGVAGVGDDVVAGAADDEVDAVRRPRCGRRRRRPRCASSPKSAMIVSASSVPPITVCSPPMKRM